MKFDLQNTFRFFNKEISIELLKINICDHALFRLLAKTFQAKVYKQIIKKASRSISNNILSLFLFNIYLAPLDGYIKNLSQLYNTDNKSQKNQAVYTLEFLIKKKKLAHFSDSLNVKQPFFKKTYNINFKHVQNEKQVKVRYLRYVSNFIVGIVGKKKSAIKIRRSIVVFIQQNFYTDIVINKIKLTNLLYDAIYFLSCKIYYVKIQ